MYITDDEIKKTLESVDRIGNELDMGFAQFRYGEDWIKYFLGLTHEEMCKLWDKIESN